MIVSEIDMFNHDLSIQSLLLYDVILYVETSRPSFPARRKPHQEGNDGRPPAQLRRKKWNPSFNYIHVKKPNIMSSIVVVVTYLYNYQTPVLHQKWRSLDGKAMVDPSTFHLSHHSVLFSQQIESANKYWRTRNVRDQTPSPIIGLYWSHQKTKSSRRNWSTWGPPNCKEAVSVVYTPLQSFSLIRKASKNWHVHNAFYMLNFRKSIKDLGGMYEEAGWLSSGWFRCLRRNPSNRAALSRSQATRNWAKRAKNIVRQAVTGKRRFARKYLYCNGFPTSCPGCVPKCPPHLSPKATALVSAAYLRAFNVHTSIVLDASSRLLEATCPRPVPVSHLPFNSK